MRRNRDSLVLLITLVPVLILIYGYFTWQTTGQWPFSFPISNLPALSVPSFLQPFSHVPAPLQQAVDQFTQNWFTMVVGTAAGVIFGVLLIGVVADVVKALFRFARGTSTPVPAMEQVAEVEPVRDTVSS